MVLRPFLSKPSVIRQDIYTSNSVIIIRLHETFPDRTFCNETTQDIQAGKVIGLHETFPATMGLHVPRSSGVLCNKITPHISS